MTVTRTTSSSANTTLGVGRQTASLTLGALLALATLAPLANAQERAAPGQPRDQGGIGAPNPGAPKPAADAGDAGAQAGGAGAQAGDAGAQAGGAAPAEGGIGAPIGDDGIIEPAGGVGDSSLRVDISPGDIDVLEFLRFLSDNTGLPVIPDSGLSNLGTPITVTAEIIDADAAIVTAILEANKFSVFREKHGGREVLRVESTTTGAGAGGEPKPTPVVGVRDGEATSFDDQDLIIDLPIKDDEIATMVFTLKFTEPADAMQALDSLVSGAKAGAKSRSFSIVDVKNSMMVIVTAKFGLLNYLKKLLTIIDVPIEEPDRIVQIFEIEHADADELVGVIEQFLSGRGGGLGGGARRRTPRAGTQRRAGAQAGSTPGSAAAAAQDQQTNLLADFRTNKLIVETYSESDIEDINMLIHELDVAFDPRRLRTHIYQVRYLKADEVAQDISVLIGAGTGGLSGRSGLSRGSRTQTRGRGVSRRGATRGATGTTTTGQPGGGGSTTQQMPAVIVPHIATNSLMIQAEPADFAEILNILGQIDIKRRQVFLEAALVQVNSSSSLNYTIELLAGDPDDQATRALFESSFGLTGIDLQNFNRVIPDISNPAAVPPGGLLAIMDRGKFPALINFFKVNSDSQVLATPFILADDNMQNIIEILETRFVQNTNTVNVSTTTSQEAEDAGITLDITPTITQDAVFLEMALAVSQFQDGGTPQLLPPKNDNSITSAVTVPDGQIFVVGGLTRENRSKTVSKLPIIGDIPLIGKLFRSERTTRSAANLYIFLRAHVLTHSEFADGLDLTAQIMDRMTEFAPDLDPTVTRPPSTPPEPPVPIDPDAPKSIPLQPRSERYNDIEGTGAPILDHRNSYDDDPESPFADLDDPRLERSVPPVEDDPSSVARGPSGPGDKSSAGGTDPSPEVRPTHGTPAKRPRGTPRALQQQGVEIDPQRESWLLPLRAIPRERRTAVGPEQPRG